MRFPYRELRDSPPPGGSEGAVSTIPMIQARVIGLTGSETVYGVLDTGAEDTLIPDRLIGRIGVHLKPGDVGDFRTADGRLFEAAYGTVDLEIERGRKLYRWRARVAFVRRPTALFGFAGFLEHFAATFDGPARHVTLKLTGKPLPAPIMPIP
jgi:hypothetical protein